MSAKISPLELKSCIEALREGRFESCPAELRRGAVLFLLSVLQESFPGQSLEVRVVPFGACKIFEGSSPNPHNLTPPDYIEFKPPLFLELATGIKSWQDAAKDLSISPFSRANELESAFPIISMEK